MSSHHVLRESEEEKLVVIVSSIGDIRKPDTTILLASVRHRDTCSELAHFWESTSILITTLCLRTLVLEEVTLSDLTDDVFSSTTDFYTFFCTGESFNFWHKREL